MNDILFFGLHTVQIIVFHADYECKVFFGLHTVQIIVFMHISYLSKLFENKITDDFIKQSFFAIIILHSVHIMMFFFKK